MTDEFQLICSVCGREPKTPPVDYLDYLRDPTVFERSEAFHLCDALDCGQVVCPEHTARIGKQGFCPEHAK